MSFYKVFLYFLRLFNSYFSFIYFFVEDAPFRVCKSTFNGKSNSSLQQRCKIALASSLSSGSKLPQKENSKDSVLRVNWNDTEDVGIVTHYKGKPFTGVCFGLHENGNLKEEYEILEGLKYGKAVTYYDNGQLLSESNWKDDKEDGLSKEYHENGVLDIESNWKEGKLDGLIKEYNENGDLEEDSNWKEGKLDKLIKYFPDGLIKEYNGNGELKAETYFKDGDIKLPSSKSNKLEKITSRNQFSLMTL